MRSLFTALVVLLSLSFSVQASAKDKNEKELAMILDGNPVQQVVAYNYLMVIADTYKLDKSCDLDGHHVMKTGFGSAFSFGHHLNNAFVAWVENDKGQKDGCWRQITIGFAGLDWVMKDTTSLRYKQGRVIGQMDGTTQIVPLKDLLSTLVSPGIFVVSDR